MSERTKSGWERRTAYGTALETLSAFVAYHVKSAWPGTAWRTRPEFATTSRAQLVAAGCSSDGFALASEFAITCAFIERVK